VQRGVSGDEVGLPLAYIRLFQMRPGRPAVELRRSNCPGRGSRRWILAAETRMAESRAMKIKVGFMVMIVMVITMAVTTVVSCIVI